METERGLSLSYDSRKAAESARFALYTARNGNRSEMKDLYPDPNDPLHGASPWDEFRVTIEEKAVNQFTVLITRHSVPAHNPTEIKEI